MNDNNKLLFPSGFTWGASTSSYQIEGSTAPDERGSCVWEMLCRQPGKVFQGHSGAVAADHVRRYQEDVNLMQQIGLQAYRFSISWPRVLPTGRGTINEKGLAFYDRLVDALLEANVQPWATLFHWDMPYDIFLQGGWLNPEIPKWFSDYTQVVVDRLSDRVQHWFTLTEPQVFLGLGLQTGEHAPGLKLGLAEMLAAFHNTLLAHGLAVQTIRARSHLKPIVGVAPVGTAVLPLSNDQTHVEQAREATFAVDDDMLVYSNTWFNDPMILGHYPQDGLGRFQELMPRIGANDMEIIQQPLDLLGVNNYFPRPLQSDGTNPFAEGYPHTAMDWPVSPEGFYWIMRFYYERYQLPIVVTENGMANLDWVHHDSTVPDPQRVDFMTSYLAALRRAIHDGADIRGYFTWSLLDNFEWAYGYNRRFGLIHVDFQTQKRTLKDSAHWYRQVIQSNGAMIPIHT